MIFANLLFIYLFLPLNVVLYYISKNTAYRNAVLILFSFIFYAWGEPVWVVMLMASAMCDYMHGRIIEKYRGTWVMKLALISSLAINLGLLITFKYSGFFAQSINTLLGTSLAVPTLSLPIGISFYTFQTLSYVIDVYRGDTKAQNNPFYYLLYLSMYFQLVAGPVVRYSDIAAEIRNRQTTILDFSEGFTRFVIGLSKKVLIANAAGKLVVELLDGDLSRLTVAGAWLGAVMYTFQIYYDFSAYSDMAIGLGRMFGFHFKENFRYPYISKSVTEFWRRWHISLSSFFRDYVYIPLGGNRKHQYLNLAVVWFLTGLWHGASWNFILWGVYYGLFIACERLFLGKFIAKLPALFQHIYLLLVVLVGWMLFYFTDFSRLGTFLSVMFGLNGNAVWNSNFPVMFFNNIIFLAVALLFCMPVVTWAKKFVIRYLKGSAAKLAMLCQLPMNVALLILCTSQLVGETYNAFLYYRF